MSTVLADVISKGTHSGRPAAGVDGRLYYETDTLLLFRDNGSSWDQVAVNSSTGLADHSAFTYLDATDAAAPADPSSGHARIYSRSGRIYSRDSGGVEYGPFDAAGGGGAALSDFRLSGVKDAPGDIPLGTYGDEFEYTSAATFAGIWVPEGSLTDYRVNGSGIIFCAGSNARGFDRDPGSNLPNDFEVAVLLSGAGDMSNMTGIGVLDTAGTGIGAFPYGDGHSYFGNIVTYVYSSILTTCTALTGNQAHAPHWLAIRRSSGTTWRFRWSADGTTWTTLAAASTKTVTNARRIYIGSFHGGSAYVTPMIHRVVYGTPDLGL